MNTPPKKPTPPTPPAPAKSADDGSIPVLTDRLGLPPLDFDTTIPLIESTVQSTQGLFAGLTALPNPPKPSLPPSSAALAAREAVAAREAMAPREPVSVHGATASNLVPSPPASPPANPAANASATRAAADGRHWARIEIELRAAILREIAEQLPREVDAIIRNRMSATIDRVLSSLAAETRLAVAASLREIVERAVHAELERLRNSNRGSF
ncbi:MAG TPA: hypothetical protein VEI29_03880 [Burkholderiaceae bacterium]|nr:hypothetical protein [Burkholderiaceae bacterium]